MVWEAVAALFLGVAVLALILEPLIFPKPATLVPVDPLEPEETPRGIALSAIREIEFDRETGKLSDVDYQFLMQKYTAEALGVLKAEEAVGAAGAGHPGATGGEQAERLVAARLQSIRSAASAAPSPACPICGPRPETDAIFCSDCGKRLPAAAACGQCGTPLHPDGPFCEECGARVAA
jgi:hypothetical protein